MQTTAVTLQLVAMSVLTTAAWAQTPAQQDQQRDVNQQQRIEQGLQSGQLSTKEAVTSAPPSSGASSARRIGRAGVFTARSIMRQPSEFRIRA
ncbi:MAG TPA: hypothetical protein VGC34_09220 [Steroidobacteraceae bacterium]